MAAGKITGSFCICGKNSQQVDGGLFYYYYSYLAGGVGYVTFVLLVLIALLNLSF